MAAIRHGRSGPLWLAAVLATGVGICTGADGPAGGRPVVAYANDFEKAVGPEWSIQQTAVTPKGARRFLGPFANHQVRLTLKDLPPHAYVRLNVDLFVMMTWDGGDLRDPDIWNLKVKNGPKLICSTFGTSPPGKPRGVQTFPNNLIGPMCPRGAGSVEEATLGYAWQGNPLDSVYRLRPTFPHTGKELTLIFSGSALQEVADESWGLDNITVELLGKAHPLAKGPLEAAWANFLGDDPVKAFDAMWALVLTGDQAATGALTLLRTPEVDGKKVRRLLQELDSAQWARRSQATEELRRMGRAVEPILAEALKGNVSAEVRMRVETLRKEFAARKWQEHEVRCLRVIRLMEVLGTPAAAKVLAAMAATGPTPEIRCLAEAGARRLAADGADWMDLLRRVDPHTRLANGEWAAGPSALHVSPVTRARLPLPVAPRGDYELVAEFVRKQGTGEVNFILPVADRGVMLSLDDHDGRSYLQNINGREDTAFDAPGLAVGQRQLLRVVVKHAGKQARIQARLNGKEVLSWKGSIGALSTQPGWFLGRSDVLGVGVNESIVSFYRLDLRMLSGKAKPVPLPPWTGPGPQPPLRIGPADLRVDIDALTSAS